MIFLDNFQVLINAKENFIKLSNYEKILKKKWIGYN